MAGEEISPALVQLVENNLLLKQAILDLRDIKSVQEANHLVAIELRDHQTIEHVDTLWGVALNARWLMAAILAILGGLYVTKQLWNWP